MAFYQILHINLTVFIRRCFIERLFYGYRFEFELSEDGLVKDIVHHREDHHEVINLKKVLASVFSAIGKV